MIRFKLPSVNWCNFNRHDWEPWQMIMEGDVYDRNTSANDGSRPIGHYKYLERKCKRCNFLEGKRVRF